MRVNREGPVPESILPMHFMVRQLLLAAFLSPLGVSTASAAWLPVAVNNEASFHFNPDTVRYQVDLMSVWVVADRVKKGTDGERSVRMQYEIDCPLVKYRITYQAMHAEPMAQGANLGTEHPNDWRTVTPGTAAELIVKKVCAR